MRPARTVRPWLWSPSGSGGPPPPLLRAADSARIGAALLSGTEGASRCRQHAGRVRLPPNGIVRLRGAP